MVQIFVKLAPTDCPGPLHEYTIVELQGDLESKQNLPFDGSFVGDLHFTKEGVPIFIIGHHILYGKSVNLDKPLAVMAKSTEQTAVERMEDTDLSSLCNLRQSTGKEYHIKAIVKKKLIFKTRPKPIIVNAPKRS